MKQSDMRNFLFWHISETFYKRQKYLQFLFSEDFVIFMLNYICQSCFCLVDKSCLFETPCIDCSAMLLCPPLSPRVCSNSCPLSHLCCLTTSFPTTPFFFCPQSFPASKSFSVSQLFASGGQSTGVSASVHPMKHLPKYSWINPRNILFNLRINFLLFFLFKAYCLKGVKMLQFPKQQ